jgi:hypothetical protein
MLKEALSGKENVKFILEKCKGHNPNYTSDAVNYLGKFGKARAKLAKRKNAGAEDKKNFVSSFDWDRMTVQDEALWDKIFAHLDN